MGVNIAVVQGRLVADVEVKHIDANGKSYDIAEFSIAFKHYTKDKSKEKSSFFNVTAFGHSAKFLGEFTNKGDEVLVSGELEQQSWTNKEGVKHSKVVLRATSVELTRKKNTDGAKEPYKGNKSNSEVQNDHSPSGGGYSPETGDGCPDFDIDSIPF